VTTFPGPEIAPGDPEAGERVDGEGRADDEVEEEDYEEGEEEEDRLRVVIKERMIQVRSLSTELKAFVGVCGLVLLVLAVLSLVRNDHIGTLVTSDAFSDDGDKAASMTQLLFAASVVFLCLGWALVVTAAARAGWITRIVTLAALALAFGTERTAATYINLSTTIIAGVLCAAVVVIVVFTWFPERDAYSASDPLGVKTAGHWKAARRLVFPVTFLLFLAIYGLIWHESRVVGYADNFPSSVADQLNNIQWFLIPIITLAGADFGDWGNFATGRTIRRFRMWVTDRIFAVVAFVVAAAIVADGMRIAYSDDGAGLRIELVLGAVVAAFAGYLLLVCKPREEWPTSYPFLILVACVTIDTVAAYIISIRVTNDPDGLISDGWDALVWLGLAGAGILLLSVYRGKLPTWLMIGALYTTMVGVVYTMTDLDSVSSIVHPFSWTPDNSPWLGYEGLKAVAGLVTIAVIIVAAVSKKITAWGQPIALLLNMTIALQVLAWIDSLYGGAVKQSGAAAVTGKLALAAAVVLVLALSWEFAASGESVTNGHHPKFPRDTRVMVFLGYVVITATTSVFFSSIGELNSGRWSLLESQFEAEDWVRDGLLFLGGPLVITIFVIAFNRWRQQQAELRAAGDDETGDGSATDDEAATPVTTARA